MRISRSHSLGRRPFRATLCIRNVFFYRIPPYELSTCYVWPASRERVVSMHVSRRPHIIQPSCRSSSVFISLVFWCILAESAL